MTLTFAIILLGLMFFIKPLQRNGFYILHMAIMILGAYYVETHFFRTHPFSSKTLMLFLVFQIISINIVTFMAYWTDKRAAQRGGWRVPEKNLHTLEFLGGWAGAILGMKLLRHKNAKASYQSSFWLLFAFEAVIVFFILRLVFKF